MSKHTPGPWEAAFSDEHANNPGGFVVRQPAGRDVAGYWSLRRDAETTANARLIAAAPDLLQACKWALVALKGREHDQFLRDAIAKAEGA